VSVRPAYTRDGIPGSGNPLRLTNVRQRVRDEPLQHYLEVVDGIGWRFSASGPIP